MAEVCNGWESGSMLETLRRRGWYLEDTEVLKAIIAIQSALANDSSKVVESVESELLNSDLRSIGAKSLPDPSLLRNPSSYIHGPKVLQISSVRDISKSCADEISRYSGGRRLLRICLTDGHSEITAIEYSHIPFIPDNVHPGTKIRLENKVAVYSGIACLSTKVLTLLGGVVQPLYEEWHMNQKYSGFARSSVRQLDDRDAGGPPPFVKLQVGSSSGSGYISKSSMATAVVAEVERPEMKPSGFKQNPALKADISNVNSNSKLPSVKPEEKPSSSGPRPKEVVESVVPMQNQAAAQKLLQKLNQNDRHSKSRKHRGKGKQEDDPVVFTLQEYESRKVQAKPLNNDMLSQDEHLAWQLQNQFNLEDSQVQGASHEIKAQDIRMSMFAYERDYGGSHQMSRGGRSRGRGRGRGRRRNG